MRFQSNYDLFPQIHVATDEKAYALAGWEAIGRELRGAVQARDADKTVLCVDCYHGVWEEEILAKLLEQPLLRKKRGGRGNQQGKSAGHAALSYHG